MKKYKVIYADPPWQVKAGPGWASNGKSRDLSYPTMSLDEIKALPVKNIADDDCILFLWTINKYVEQTYEVARRWGFKPSTLLTWTKPPHGLGLGGAFVQTTEHLLVCRRGKPKTTKRIDTTWFHHKRGRHSEKPQMFRDIIKSIIPEDYECLEMFARTKADGWDIWGNELKNDIELSPVEFDKISNP